MYKSETTEDKNTYFYKIACKYMALTELYDRNLTDMRSRYDPTQAFIPDNITYSLSCIYAKKLKEELMRYSFKFVAKEIQKYNNYSAQKWIDEYERLKCIYGEY